MRPLGPRHKVPWSRPISPSAGERIVRHYGDYRGLREIDACRPDRRAGFIDTHLHVESSLVTPAEFRPLRAAPRRGPRRSATRTRFPTSSARGLRYFLDSAAHTRMDLRVQLSQLRAGDPSRNRPARGSMLPISAFIGHPKVIGLPSS